MWEEAIRLFLVVLIVVLYGVLGYITYLSWRMKKLIDEIGEIARKMSERGGGESWKRK